MNHCPIILLKIKPRFRSKYEYDIVITIQYNNHIIKNSYLYFELHYCISECYCHHWFNQNLRAGIWTTASHPYVHVLVCAIGETNRRLEQKVKERQDVCKRGDEVSAIAEHAWQQHHPIEWEVVGVVNRASMNCELKIKESLYIQMTPHQDIINGKHTLQYFAVYIIFTISPLRI